MLLMGTAVFMLCSIISSQLINIARELFMSRMEIKTSLSVEAAMMMPLKVKGPSGRSEVA